MKIPFNSQIRPKGFPHDFDVHIYFSEDEVSVAQQLKEQFENEFASAVSSGSVFVGNLIPQPIGPHPLPMFEINFAKAQFGEVVPWLMRNRKDLNVLVHSISQNDLYDHTQGALWLGQQLALDLSRF